jgi:hypothetical protein
MENPNVNVKNVINPTNKTVSDETKQLIDKLLLERIYLGVIARVTGVSWPCLQNYVNNKFSQAPRQVKVTDKPKGKLIIARDELFTRSDFDVRLRTFGNQPKNFGLVYQVLTDNMRLLIQTFGSSIRQ